MNVNSQMTLVDALQILAETRRDQVVVTTMSAARQWMRISEHPLDLHFVPSTMGGGLSLGLGLALARPERDVIVLSGDGCLLMNLGSLVTAAVSNRSNFTVILIDNGVYETTGCQKLVTTGSPIDLADLARATKFANVTEFETLQAWRNGAEMALKQPGPHCVILKIAPTYDDYVLTPPGPMPERLVAFSAALDRG